jgi:hypothetical protein
MREHHYAPRFSKRATLGALAAITIGVFGLGMAVPYVVGEDPAADEGQRTTETTVRRRQPVPVAQVVETTTTTAPDTSG